MSSTEVAPTRNHLEMLLTCTYSYKTYQILMSGRLLTEIKTFEYQNKVLYQILVASISIQNDYILIIYWLHRDYILLRVLYMNTKLN